MRWDRRKHKNKTEAQSDADVVTVRLSDIDIAIKNRKLLFLLTKLLLYELGKL